MFALPGIACLIVFILARPQEFVEVLQKAPLLYLFLAAAVAGYLLDLKLRRLEPIAAPTLPWIVALVLWAVICSAVKMPEQLPARIIELGIVFVLFGTIAHGVQRFRSFHVIAGTVMATCLFLAFVCWHQGHQPRGCVATDELHPGEGTPDGRPCETSEDCRGPDAEPGQTYRCEKVGMFGTFSIEDRVRYRGELHDPNELSMVICAGGLSLLIAFAFRKRNARWTVLAALGTVLVAWTVIMSQSRGGMIVFLMVPFVYFVKRVGVIGIAIGAMMALPVLALGGRSGSAADMSTILRYEAWGAGLQMFLSSPVFGVGMRQFTEHHAMTAHNSYVLVIAEMGIVGLFLFLTVIYLSVKILWRGVRELEGVPGADAARTWGLALLASFAGILFQINTLSFSYHSVLWIFFGLAGGYWSAVHHHLPSFEVRMTGRDLAAVGAGTLAFAFVVLPLFLRWKHVL